MTEVALDEGPPSHARLRPHHPALDPLAPASRLGWKPRTAEGAHWYLRVPGCVRDTALPILEVPSTGRSPTGQDGQLA